MKYETQELIFAAQVRTLAVGIRADAAFKEKQAIEANLPEDQHESSLTFAQRHALAHPAEEYVPAAMGKIEAVAGAIRAYLKSQS